MCWQCALQSVFVVSKLYEWAENLTFDLHYNKSNSITLSVFSYKTFVWNLFLFGILILEFFPKHFCEVRVISDRSPDMYHGCVGTRAVWRTHIPAAHHCWLSAGCGFPELQAQWAWIILQVSSDCPVVLELMLSCWRGNNLFIPGNTEFL